MRAVRDWTPFELERRRWVEELGLPTLANHYRDGRLLAWAKAAGCHVYIGRDRQGRGGTWGNPFALGKDGDRDTVIALFATQHLPSQSDLLAALPTLDGKVLECFCLPARCHGEVLLAQIPGYDAAQGLTPWQRLDDYLTAQGLRLPQARGDRDAARATG